MSPYHLYWGETHHNTYQAGPQDPPLETVCRTARSHLDFYGMAYYTCTAKAFEAGGHPGEQEGQQPIVVEHWKDPQQIEREWQEVVQATQRANDDGRFVVYPGYEWHGDTTWGDHNVFYQQEGPPVHRVQSLPELYEKLRQTGGLAIPHHTAYKPGRRSPDWHSCDTDISPFAEVYSIHGCSETDEGYLPMRQNKHMGPAPITGSTYQDALDLGLHLGAICSTDHWADMPGHYGQGLMGCWASERTRAGIWEAMRSRRVYGVTGDRMNLWFTVNDQPMGTVIEADDERRLHVAVTGADAIDRIEVLRADRVIATHNHQGAWTEPKGGRRSRFKVRIEAGWGLRPNTLSLPDHHWDGQLEVDGGRMLDYDPAWISPDQTPPRFDNGRARLGFVCRQSDITKPTQNATVLEFEAEPDSPIRLTLNGQERHGTVAKWMHANAVMYDELEARRTLSEQGGLDPDNLPRYDPIYFSAHKALVHKAIPEEAYTATFDLSDDQPLDRETPYRIRVQQRNGQMAWSSPIWVRPR